MLLYGTVNEQDSLYNLQDSPRSVVCPRKLVVAFAPWLVTAQGLSQRPLRLDPSEERRAWVSRQKLQKYFIDELSIDVKDDNKCHGLFKRALEVGRLGRRAPLCKGDNVPLGCADPTCGRLGSGQTGCSNDNFIQVSPALFLRTDREMRLSPRWLRGAAADHPFRPAPSSSPFDRARWSHRKSSRSAFPQSSGKPTFKPKQPRTSLAPSVPGSRPQIASPS